MKTEVLVEKLFNKEVVYLYDDFEQVVIKIVPTKNQSETFAKRSGKPEYKIDNSSKLVYEAKIGGKLVDKVFYDNF